MLALSISSDFHVGHLLRMWSCSSPRILSSGVLSWNRVMSHGHAVVLRDCIPHDRVSTPPTSSSRSIYDSCEQIDIWYSLGLPAELGARNPQPFLACPGRRPVMSKRASRGASSPAPGIRRNRGRRPAGHDEGRSKRARDIPSNDPVTRIIWLAILYRHRLLAQSEQDGRARRLGQGGLAMPALKSSAKGKAESPNGGSKKPRRE